MSSQGRPVRRSSQSETFPSAGGSKFQTPQGVEGCGKSGPTQPVHSQVEKHGHISAMESQLSVRTDAPTEPCSQETPDSFNFVAPLNRSHLAPKATHSITSSVPYANREGHIMRAPSFVTPVTFLREGPINPEFLFSLPEPRNHGSHTKASQAISPDESEQPRLAKNHEAERKVSPVPVPMALKRHRAAAYSESMANRIRAVISPLEQPAATKQESLEQVLSHQASPSSGSRTSTSQFSSPRLVRSPTQVSDYLRTRSSPPLTRGGSPYWRPPTYDDTYDEEPAAKRVKIDRELPFQVRRREPSERVSTPWPREERAAMPSGSNPRSKRQQQRSRGERWNISHERVTSQRHPRKGDSSGEGWNKQEDDAHFYGRGRERSAYTGMGERAERRLSAMDLLRDVEPGPSWRDYLPPTTRTPYTPPTRQRLKRGHSSIREDPRENPYLDNPHSSTSSRRWAHRPSINIYQWLDQWEADCYASRSRVRRTVDQEFGRCLEGLNTLKSSL